MTATVDTPALRRLDGLERTTSSRARPASRPSTPSMGYQPGLDGLRAISVIAVICYHAGFGWMHGGFFGVEVFFVVSGFLITSLLIEERERTGRIALRQFWARRARRLLPALGAVLVTVATWTAVFGSDEQLSQMRRDLPWSMFYVANWGQVLGDVPYFAAGDPPLLRHLWSLAVEEQWYLLWPFAFVLLTRRRLTPTQCAGWLVGLAVAIMTFTFWLHSGGPSLIGGPGVRGIGSHELHVPVDVHPLDRTAARGGGRVRVATVAYTHRGPARPGTPTRRCMRRRDRDARLHLRCGDDHRRLRVPVAAAARVGVVVGGGADGRAPGRARREGGVLDDAAGRDRSSELRAVPLALADLRVRRRDGWIRRPVRARARRHRGRVRALLPVHRDADP